MSGVPLWEDAAPVALMALVAVSPPPEVVAVSLLVPEAVLEVFLS